MVKVIGIGDNVVDKYIHTRTMYPGGNALNFSVYAKLLGAESAYLGIFGSDISGDHIKKTLSKIRVESSKCIDAKGENGYALVDLQNGDRVFLGSNKGGIRSSLKLCFSPEDLEYIKGFELVHTSIYSFIENELQTLKQTGVPLSFDFSDDFSEKDLQEICPLVNFSFLSCSHLSDKEVYQLLEKVNTLGCGIAAATMGSRGALLYDGSQFYTQSPEYVEAIDTLGAGDAFITAFLKSYLENKKQNHFSDSVLLGNSLKSAAVFAAKICKVEGAFGFGLQF